MADKTLNQIRTTFLDYFQKNDHEIVDSSNLEYKNGSIVYLEDSVFYE